MDQQRKICVGRITGAHGLRGQLRLRSFTEDPAAIFDYPVIDNRGALRRLTLQTAMGEEFIISIDGATTREAAMTLRGLELFVQRADLPAAGERQFYRADLIGLKVEDEAGAPLGSILAMHDYGAGAVLEIKLLSGRAEMLPFSDAFVPVVDIAGGRVVAAPPEDWLTIPKATTTKKKKRLPPTAKAKPATDEPAGEGAS